MARILALLALIVAVLSLALNILLIDRLLQARVVVADVLDHTSQRLGTLSDLSFKQTIRINHTFSVSGEMPFNQNFSVPVSMTVPVNTSINVNVTTPFGPMSMPVSVNTSVPIKMQVPVAISQTIPYSVTVPLDLQVPVDVRLGDLGITPAIKDMQDQIQRLRELLTLSF
jgi:hypothetical protein